MKKSEIIRQYDCRATSIFIAAAVALLINAVATGFQAIVNISADSINALLLLLALFCMFFAYTITIKGFSTVNKACKLSEENENYFLGKKLMVLTVVCLILTAVLTVTASIFNSILMQYYGESSLMPSDYKAAENVKFILAVISIFAQIASVSTPFIFYLWRIHKATPKTDSINNFALLTMIIMIVHLVIGILNSVYSIRGAQLSFLSGFSRVLLIVKYLVLMLFFITRRKFLISPQAAEKTADEQHEKQEEA